MNVVLKGKLAGHDWLFRVGRLRKVLGINSNIKNGEHILMWEFDGLTLDEVTEVLSKVQDWYDLPTVRICHASNRASYHAYCFVAVGWQLALAIVASTPNIDMDWFKMCVQREHFTLRLTDKGHGQPEIVRTLSGFAPEDVSVGDLTGAVEYQAWMRSE